MRLAPKTLATMAALIAVALLCSPAGAGGQENFSFLVLGDSRGHYYLPGGQEDETALHDVFPKKKKYHHVQFHFDPVSKQLVWARILPRPGKPAMTLTYKEGWPQILREEVKGRGEMVVMRDAGRRWVFDMVASQMQTAMTSGQGPGFAVHTGDVVVWGGQGNTLATSPYWQRFKLQLLDKLPPLAKGGPSCRLFLAIGNHDMNRDPHIRGIMTTLPCLKKVGMSPQRRIYSFIYKGARFIFLDTGRWGKGQRWNACCPPRQEQFVQLEKWLQQATAEKARQVFVVFHMPVYASAGRGGLPPNESPHPILKRYADKLSITVFNGDVHTTEAFWVDGVRYLVLGGAGAPQKLAKPKPKPGYPTELYWKGAPRVEEYNYAIVGVQGDKLTIDVHRFRPTQPQAPSALVRIFGEPTN